jgi:hypothetical protein
VEKHKQTSSNVFFDLIILKRTADGEGGKQRDKIRWHGGKTKRQDQMVWGENKETRSDSMGEKQRDKIRWHGGKTKRQGQMAWGENKETRSDGEREKQRGKIRWLKHQTLDLVSK